MTDHVTPPESPRRSEITAPGKLLLSGEYAVLGGATAVVIAVDRRARAYRGVGPSSPFLDAVAAQLATRFGAEHPSARAIAEIAVDTSTFSLGEQKLGLGSSAAATVAATALALSAAPSAGRRGSGADIAASTYGGVLAYAALAETVATERLPIPSSVQLLPFFTGHSADTVTMVARVHQAGRGAQSSVQAIADASSALAAGLRGNSARAILAAVAAGARAIAALGEAAGYDIETGAVRNARSVLTRWGGAVKTTGAGGGDLAVAVIANDQDRTEVIAALRHVGCEVLPLCIDRRGVDLSPPPL
jgi:phosphomevalonate kinase